MMRVSVVVLFCALAGSWAAPVRADGDNAPPVASSASSDGQGFRCDGTDPFFFAERDQAGMLGYGETWDEHVCDEGVEIYAPGTTARWKALRQRRALARNDEQQMLALIMPVIVFGGGAALFAIAFAFAAVSRLRKRVVLEVPCPACSAKLPIAVDDRTEHALFCPMCGAACRVDVAGKGPTAQAHAVPL